MRIEVNGININYEVFGNGTPIILLHGNGENHTIFDLLIESIYGQAYYTIYNGETIVLSYLSNYQSPMLINFDKSKAENEEIFFYVNDTNIISGEKIIDVKYYHPITQGEYITGTGTESIKHLYTTTLEGNETIYLEEIAAKYIVSSQSTVDSNVVCSLTLSPELFNDIFADGTTGSVKIYIGAQTTLDYDSTRADEQTAVVFTNITVKARDMFNLD